MNCCNVCYSSPCCCEPYIDPCFGYPFGMGACNTPNFTGPAMGYGGCGPTGGYGGCGPLYREKKGDASDTIEYKPIAGEEVLPGPSVINKNLVSIAGSDLCDDTGISVITSPITPAAVGELPLSITLNVDPSHVAGCVVAIKATLVIQRPGSNPDRYYTSIPMINTMSCRGTSAAILFSPLTDIGTTVSGERWIFHVKYSRK